MSVDPATLSAPTVPAERYVIQRDTAPGVDETAVDFAGVATAIFGEDGLTFDDVLDVVNPLHHIPVVSTLYRYLTDDTIAPGPRLAGGGLFGGLVGFAGAAVNLAIEEGSGKDIGDHVLALLLDEDDPAGGGNAPPRPQIDVASLEPHERVAALAGYSAVPPAAEPVAFAGIEEDLAPERTAAAPVLAAAKPAPAPLDFANLEPGERVAMLTAQAAPAPEAATAAVPTVATLAAVATPSLAPPSPIPVSAAPLSLPGTPQASAPAASLPSLSGQQWLALTRALDAHAIGPAQSAATVAQLYQSNQ
jgi:hypothetical protein